MILFLLTSLASALGCADPFTVDEFEQLVVRAERALDNDDVMAHGKTWVRMKESLPCLEEPAPAELWARYLIGYAIIRHATGEEWRAPLITALSIDPDIERSYGHDDIRLFPVPPEEPLRGLELAPGETFYLDGRKIDAAPPYLEGPHIAQLAGAPFKTRLLQDEDFPYDWLKPEPVVSVDPQPEPKPDEPQPEERRRRTKRAPTLAIAGAAVAVGGAGLAIGTALAAENKTYETPQQWGTDVALNATGWALAGVGTGLIVVHFARGPKLSAGPARIQLHTRF